MPISFAPNTYRWIKWKEKRYHVCSVWLMESYLFQVYFEVFSSLGLPTELNLKVKHSIRF